MAESRHFAESELDRALQDLAQHIDYPPTPDLTRAIRDRIERPPRSRHWRHEVRGLASSWYRLAAAVLVLLALGTAVVLSLSPSARTGVAERFGLRGVRIVITASPAAPATATARPAATPTSTPNPSATNSAMPGRKIVLGKPVTLAQAGARVDFQVLVPGVTDLSSPDAVYFDETPPGGMVSLVWGPRPDLPALPNTDVGVLIDEFHGSLDPNLFVKMAQPSQIHVVTVNGATGYWIDGGPHYLAYRDAEGNFQFKPDRLAGNTLLWEQGGLTFRLESQLSEADALEIAASMH